MNRECGIYCIQNKINGKRYIGSSIDLRRRWSQHKSNLRGNRSHHPYLQHAWNKYGEQAFEFSVWAALIPPATPQELIDLEQDYVDFFGPEYNACRECVSVPIGIPVSATTRAKIGATLRGRKRGPCGPETRAAIAASMTGKKMGPHSAETRAKISAAHKGKRLSVEHRARISAIQRGRKQSEESKAKRSVALKNKPWSAARRAACRRPKREDFE